MIKENDLAKNFPKLGEEAKVGTVKPYDANTKSKLGQVLNSEADYTRAVSRKNGKVKAVFTTEKGNFTIELLPEDAPLTVDNFVKLAKSGLFQQRRISPRRAEFCRPRRRSARRRKRRSGLFDPRRNEHRSIRTRRGRNGTFGQKYGRFAMVCNPFAATASRRRLHGFRQCERSRYENRRYARARR